MSDCVYMCVCRYLYEQTERGHQMSFSISLSTYPFEVGSPVIEAPVSLVKLETRKPHKSFCRCLP